MENNSISYNSVESRMTCNECHCSFRLLDEIFLLHDAVLCTSLCSHKIHGHTHKQYTWNAFSKCISSTSAASSISWRRKYKWWSVYSPINIDCLLKIIVYVCYAQRLRIKLSVGERIFRLCALSTTGNERDKCGRQARGSPVVGRFAR